ncbi:hypothetical protein ACFLQR_01435 [Verrucomicrobiota bacterium]
MRAIDWQRVLQEQREEHGKVVFTATELANASARDWQSLKVTLQRLVARGVIQRYADGRYGLPGAVTVEDLVPSLDSSAYVTGMYALYRQQLVTQVPAEIHCFTSRRHNRSRIRATSVGRIVFVCITGSVYAHPEESVVTPPEQALCDFVYLCRKRRVASSDIVTFRNLRRLETKKVQAHLSRYPETVKREVILILRADLG